MRRIVALTLMSLDGAVDDPHLYFQPSERPDQPFVFDHESDAFERATTSTQDAVLLGRNMWEEWRRYWPGVSSPFADFINGVTKYVVTSRPLDASWETSIAVQQPVERFVGQLKTRHGGDIGVHGSIQLVQSLLDSDLVDELRIVAGPVAGLPGRRLFEGVTTPKRYRLQGAVPTSTGNLLLTYERAATT